MDAIKLLYQMHAQQTLSTNPPFTYCVVIKTSNINMHLIDELYKNNNTLNLFMDSCFEEFKQLKLSFGSVHYDPNIWIKIVIQTIKFNKNENKITFPNGCCTKIDCPINLMYEIVLKKVTK